MAIRKHYMLPIDGQAERFKSAESLHSSQDDPPPPKPTFCVANLESKRSTTNLLVPKRR